ncbi:hypothetical protein ABK040_007342 [Willaertia magna]
MFNKTVTIIGAGPGGLALARILQIRGIKVAVYEREESIEQRDQGGTLDLHFDKGQVALKAANLFEEFKKISRPEGQETKILDKYANILLTNEEESILNNHNEDNNNNDIKEQDFSRPEVDRLDLRKLLLSSLKEGTVQFNKALVSIEKSIVDNNNNNNKGRHKVLFKDGTSVETDLLIGCDGTWSKVRSSFCDNKPNYSGVTFIETRISNPEECAPQIAKLVGNGSVYAFSDNKGIMAQRNSDKRIRIYFVLRIPENDLLINQIDFNDASIVKEILINEFKDWNEELIDFINKSDSTFIKRPIYAFPPQWNWKTVEGVTIIGDAAHVMSPFAGLGVNLALLDASDLAVCLTNNNDWFLAIQQFEKKMFERSKSAAIETEVNLNACIKEGPPNEFVDYVKQFMTSKDN